MSDFTKLSQSVHARYNAIAKYELFGVDIRLREMGLKTEFLGRVGLVFGLEKVTLEQMKEILVGSPLLKNYLALFEDVKKDDVVGAIMEVVEANYEKNTIGVRLINTLIHQFFINGGLSQKEAKKVAFQKTLTLH